MNDSIELVDGFYWPKTGGKSCREVTTIRGETPAKISKYCKNFGTVVTAGANVGYYVKQYSKLFKTVYTFEPDPINFQCLDLNVAENNVVKVHGVLGNNNEKVGLSIHCDDCGAWRVSGTGDIQTYKIDDLNLPELDLLALDVEGFEMAVLNGATQTINKYWPVVVVEANNETDACRFLVKIGYSKVDEVNGDWVFVKNE